MATDPKPGPTGSSLSPSAIGYISFGTTILVVIVLFLLDVIPLWLAAAILVADGAFTYFLITKLESADG